MGQFLRMTNQILFLFFLSMPTLWVMESFKKHEDHIFLSWAIRVQDG